MGTKRTESIKKYQAKANQRISLAIDIDLYNKAKEKCTAENISMRSILIEALRKFIAE